MYNLAGRRNGMNPQANGRTGCFGCSGCIVPIVGLIFLVIGIYMLKDTLNFLPGTATAQGTITHCTYSNDDSSDNLNQSLSTCSPTVQFKTKSGQSITIGSSVSSSSFYQGQVVQVRYHPKTPYDGRIDSFMSTWFIPLMCGGMGLLVLLLSPLILLRGLLNGLGIFRFLGGILGGNR